jgi:hypothetical protein
MKKFQRVITQLIEQHGLSQAFQADEFHLRLTNEPYMPLVIEKIGPGRVSVCHYGEQNGDLMKDPDMTFRIENGVWQAASFENSYIGAYQEVFVERDGKTLYYPRLKRELESSAATWANNLIGQRWLERSVGESLTHPHQVRDKTDSIKVVSNKTSGLIENRELTTPDYWDCECQHNYIHPRDQEICSICGAIRTDQPDSRLAEVYPKGDESVSTTAD